MKKALLVIGGEPAAWHIIKQRISEFDYICAADSGLDVLRNWNIMPDLVVGDMDSIQDTEVLSLYKNVLVFPRAKDYSDTELGMLELQKQGYEHIVLAGGGGGRLDHLLAIRALFERAFSPVEWIGPKETLVRVALPREFHVDIGQTISVFPLASGASNMHSKGLVWPLDGLSWDIGQYGLSNISNSDIVFIDPGEKPLLVIIEHSKS